jgi:hypothetical protein
VTSAAVGFGCLKLKLAQRPKNLALKQAVAAAGQSQLIRMYEDLFGVYGVPVAQVLLSRFDFSAKDRLPEADAPPLSHFFTALRQVCQRSQRSQGACAHARHPNHQRKRHSFHGRTAFW